MLHILTSSQQNSSDFLVPIIQKELELLTVEGEQIFTKVVNFNKLVETDIVSDAINDIMRQNLQIKTTPNVKLQEDIEDLFYKNLSQVNKFLTIKVNAVSNLLEFQFYLYHVQDNVDINPGIYKRVLLDDPIAYHSIIVDPLSPSASLRSAIRKLFPMSNKPPSAAIYCNGIPCSDYRAVRNDTIYLPVGDSITMRAQAFDEDNSMEELTLQWKSINDSRSSTYNGDDLLVKVESVESFSVKFMIKDLFNTWVQYGYEIIPILPPEEPLDSFDIVLIRDFLSNNMFHNGIDTNNLVNIDFDGYNFSYLREDSPLSHNFIEIDLMQVDNINKYNNPRLQDSVTEFYYKKLKHTNKFNGDDLFLFMVSDTNYDKAVFFAPVKPSEFIIRKDYELAITPIVFGYTFDPYYASLRVIEVNRSQIAMGASSSFIQLDDYQPRSHIFSINVGYKYFLFPNVILESGLYIPFQDEPTKLNYVAGASSLSPYFALSVGYKLLSSWSIGLTASCNYNEYKYLTYVYEDEEVRPDSELIPLLGLEPVQIFEAGPFFGTGVYVDYKTNWGFFSFSYASEFGKGKFHYIDIQRFGVLVSFSF